MRRRPNPDSEPNIKRIDTRPRARKQTHGFQVHLLRGTEAVTKMFSDAVHGGKEAARRTARKFKRLTLAGAAERRALGLTAQSSRIVQKPRKRTQRGRSKSAKRKSR